jgi:hypothetical protein
LAKHIITFGKFGVLLFKVKYDPSVPLSVFGFIWFVNMVLRRGWATVRA